MRLRTWRVQVGGGAGGQDGGQVVVVDRRVGARHHDAAARATPVVLVQRRVALHEARGRTSGRATAQRVLVIGVDVEKAGVQIRGQGGRIAGGHQRRRHAVGLADGDVDLDPVGVSVEVLQGVCQPAEAARAASPSTSSLPPGPGARAVQDDRGEEVPRLLVRLQMSTGLLAPSMWRNASAKNASLPTAPAPGGGPTMIWSIASWSTPSGASASRVMRHGSARETPAPVERARQRQRRSRRLPPHRETQLGHRNNDIDSPLQARHARRTRRPGFCQRLLGTSQESTNCDDSHGGCVRCRRCSPGAASRHTEAAPVCRTRGGATRRTDASCGSVR